ncbi:hypothetical protein ISP17_03455 [Dyella ginsengisoli]|uniref:Uncharacterized protein n=1 Tax=Dyella ginsengisoli TaxID=363848 RepID=A0ABW8JS39_9GAMM
MMGKDKDERSTLPGEVSPQETLPHDEPTGSDGVADTAPHDISGATGTSEKDALLAAHHARDYLGSITKHPVAFSKAFAAAEPVWMKAVQKHQDALGFGVRNSPFEKFSKLAFPTHALGQAVRESPWQRFAKENSFVLGALTKTFPIGSVMKDPLPSFNLASSMAEPVWTKAMRERRSEFLDVVERVSKSAFVFSPMLEQARKFQEQFASQFKAFDSSFFSASQQFADIARRFKAYPEEVREGLAVMGKHGWCLDFDMGASAPIRFKNLVEEERVQEAHQEMVCHFDARVDSIKQELCDLYPKRQHIIEAAFEAYANAQYILAIPTILAQIDGICLDVVDAHFFMAKGRKKVKDHVMSIASGSISSAFLAPFEIGLEVSLSERDRPEGFSGLNRHMVLHGESVDYGTKENCLKAISVLNYISQSIQRVLGDEEENQPAQLVNEVAEQGPDS